MNQILENPAYRLQTLINKMKTIPHNTSIRQAWAQIFDLNADNFYEILLRVTFVIQLTYEAEAAIKQVGVRDHKVFLDPLQKIRTAISHQHFGAAWKNVMDQIDDRILTVLETCNQLLSATSLPDNLIEQDKLDELLDDLNALREKITASDLPDRLKHFLIYQLENLRASLIDYQFLGPTQLEEVLATVIGKTYLFFKEEPKPKEVAQDLYRDYWGIISKVADLLQLSQALLPPVIDVVQKAVLSLSQ